MNVKKVVLKRSVLGYGFSLKDNGHPFSSSATVVKVEAGGSADLGGVRAGDRIRAINGRPVQSMTFLEASNAVRVSSQFVELELEEPAIVLPIQGDNSYPSDSGPVTCEERKHETAHSDIQCVTIADKLKQATQSRHTADRPMCQSAKDEVAVSCIDSVASAVVTDAIDTPIDCACATRTSVSLISSIPFTNASPTRLSISASADSTAVNFPGLLTTTTNVASRTPLDRPVPRQQRVPLASFNHLLVSYPTDSGSQVAAELIASTPSNSVLSSSKETTVPMSSSVIFGGPVSLTDGLSQSDTSTGHDSTHVVDSNYSDASFLDVRTRNSDANVTKKAHRRQTFTRAYLDEIEGSGNVPSVRFVRKRAYASARQAGRFDRFAAFSLSPENTWTNHSPSSLTAGTVESSASPCQLLPAADPLSTPPSNIHVSEPKITHLPRRRSTKTHSDHPNVSLRRSRISGDYRLMEDNAPFSVVPVVTDDSKPNEPNHDQQALNNEDVNAKVETISQLASITQDDKTAQQTSEPPMTNLNQTQTSNHPSVVKPNQLTSRLWASFDSDPNDSPFGWWSRAGETYQRLDLEYQQLMKRQSRLQQRQRRPDDNEPENEFSHISNKENKADGIIRSSEQVLSFVKGPATHMNASLNANGTWSSPIYRRNDNSLVPSLGADLVDVNESQLTEYGVAGRRRQFRILCSGLRYHRSESNIHHDAPGSFRSRQSLCKILTLDGSINKSFSWKPYYMCIAGSEVRFVKASLGFSSSSRKSKSAKQLADIALASRNLNLSGLIDDSRSWEGSFSSGRPGLNASDAQSGPVSVTSSSCVILPIPGLIWNREEVPQDLPHWRPLASTSTSVVRKPSPVPDVMDPLHSGLSGLSDNAPIPDHLCPTESDKTDDSVLQSSIQCYRFTHVNAGVELLFVFPDKNTAMACLTMCEMSGGHEASSLDSKMSCIHSQPRRGVSTPNVKAPTQNHSESCDQATELIKPEGPRSIGSAVPTLWPHISGAPFRLTDRRQRRVDKQFSTGGQDPVCQVIPISASASTPPDIQSNFGAHINSNLVGTATAHVVASQALPRSASVMSNPDASAVVEDKSSQRSSKSRNATPFLRGFKQWLNRPAYSISDQSTSLTHNPELTIDAKLSTLFADPPDLSDFESPGAVFGSPLECQVPSPDHLCVPVILHALVLGLEIHGLQITGLYRKPGRHRTIAQFVCVVNLVPNNIDLLLRLDAWHEPNALCGLVKHFLRRLPVGLFAPATWEPLASLVDNHQLNNPSQLAYLLLSIRVKLRKLASDAFGIRSGHVIPGTTNSPERSSDVTTLVAFPGTSDSPKPGSPIPSRDSPDSTEGIPHPTPATWRWATLCYLVAHIRDVVAYRHLNEVSYQCIAICFGPVFFGDSTNLPRLNGVLENLFRHWPWLTWGLPMVTQETLDSDKQAFVKTPPDYTLSEAIDYLMHCESPLSNRVPSPLQSAVDACPNNPMSYTLDCGLVPTSTEDQINTHGHLGVEDVTKHSDRLLQFVRPLLNRALKSHAVPEKPSHKLSGADSTTSALQRTTSVTSSFTTPRNSNMTGFGVLGGRRKTVDTHTVRAVQHIGAAEFRRLRPGRAGLDPKHLEPIRSDPSSDFAEQVQQQPDSSHALNLTTDGVIPRPTIPTRNYRYNLSVGRSTKSPS